MRAVAFACTALAVLVIPNPVLAEPPPGKPAEGRLVTPAPFRTINAAEPAATDRTGDKAGEAKASGIRSEAAASARIESKPAARAEAAFAAVLVDPAVSAAAPVAAPVAGGKPEAAPIAEAPPKPKPRPVTLAVAVDLKRQQARVSVNGETKYTWAISSGRSGYDTPNGSFRPQWAAKLWHSKQYDDAPMPHSVFFNGGIAFHATTSVRLLGRPASHGCIRLAPTSAATLYDLVHKHGYASTRITVEGHAPAPAIARRDSDDDRARRYAGGGGVRAYQMAPRGGYASAYPPGYQGPQQRVWPGDQPTWGWSNGNGYGYGRRYY